MKSFQISSKFLTVVLPAFNERENLIPLIEEIQVADNLGIIKRVIVVDDDSPDGTSELIKNQDFSLDVLCLRRVGRIGLSSAVVEGILLADTPLVAVMDSDGQHSPSDLMRMVEIYQQNRPGLIIGSRFKDFKEQETHQGIRSLLSNIGNSMSQKLLGKKLTDPLSGFFLIEREVFSSIVKSIRPTGFKILLEILFSLRNKPLILEEVHIDFRARVAGESKLDSAIILEFIEQILNRFCGGMLPEKILGFSLVGGSGVFIHLLVLYFANQIGGASFVLAQSIATVVAIVWNYILNNLLTFRRNRKRGAAWFKGLLLFAATCGLGALANVGVADILNKQDFDWLASGLAGVMVGIVFNFTLSKFFVWKG